MAERYSDYKEIGVPKKGIFKKAAELFGNSRKIANYETITPKSMQSLEMNEVENVNDIDTDYFNPFEGKRGKDELRKKKPKKSKAKRKTKGCGCK